MDQAWITILPAFLRNKLEGRYDLQKILANIGWLFADKLLRLSVGMFVGVWLARYLGPHQYGQLSYVVSYVSIFTAIATMGLNSIVVRNVVREPNSSGTVLGSAITVQFFGSIFAISLIVGSIAWLRADDSLTEIMVVILGFSLLFKPSEVIRYWFESQVQSRYSVIVENIVFILIICIKVVMIMLHASLLTFVWVYFAEALLVAVGLLIMYVRCGGSLATWRPRIVYIKCLIEDCWPLVLSSIAVIIYLRVDQIMLAEMAGDASVGIYSAAVTISEICYFIPVSIVASIYPSIIKAKQISEETYRKQMQQLYDLMVITAFAITIPMAAYSDKMILTLYGNHYSESGAVLFINVWSNVFVFLGTACSIYTNIENIPKYSFIQTALGVIFNILLNLVLIPVWDGKGAALATVISYSIATFSVILFKRTRNNALLMLNAFNIFRVFRNN